MEDTSEGEPGFWRAPDGTVGLVDLRPLSPTSTYGFFATAEPLADSNYTAIGDGSRLDEYYPTGIERSAWDTLLSTTAQPTGTLLDWLWDVLTVDADPEGGTRAKPILPTHLGQIELHLGGHSLVRTRPWRGVETPGYERVLRVVQNDIASAHPSVRGKLLGAMARKYARYGVVWRDLVSDMVRGLRPETPATTVSDDFNRSDGALGANWTVISGTWVINSNRAQRTAGAGWAKYATALSSSDMYAEASLSSAALSVFCRASGTSLRYGYGAESRYVGGPRMRGMRQTTVIIADQAALSANGVFRVTADGSTITITDSTYEYTATDTAISAGSEAGLYADYTAQFFDDFVAEDLLSGPTGTPYYYNRRRAA